MPIAIAALLGILEGLTEFLPVSSTGHLLLASKALGVRGSGAFEIVIQFGAVLAVVVEYRSFLLAEVRGFAKGGPGDRRFFGLLLLAFVPTAAFGLLFRKSIKSLLTGVTPIAVALVVGGVLMMLLERFGRAPENPRRSKDLSFGAALGIGFAQSLALIPGMSRSMCTIVAGRLFGMRTSDAAEFSFLLGIPTLGAACLYEAYKSRAELFSSEALFPSVVGLLTSFVVAWGVMRLFLRYLARHGLTPFGLYRIAMGALLLAHGAVELG